MKQIGRILSVAVLAATGLFATPATSTAQTSTLRWQGTDPETLKTSGETFFLYNVGTGTFVTAGAEWGTQAVVKFQDYGASMNFDSGLITSEYANHTNTAAKYLGFNFPGYTFVGSFGDIGTNTCGVILEAQATGDTPSSYSRSMTFTQTDDGAYTIMETITNSRAGSAKEIYYGTEFGMSSAKEDSMAEVGDGALAVAASVPTGYEKNYEWIFVSKTEFESVISAMSPDAAGGLNANVSYLIKDPFFDRNHDNAFASWKTAQASGNSDGDYWYNWETPATSDTTPWSAFSMRKVQWPDNPYGQDYGKYGYVIVDGKGELYQEITVKEAGSYEIECNGLYQGNEAYLFVEVNGTRTKAVLVNAGSEFKKGSQSETPQYYTWGWYDDRYTDTDNPYYTVSAMADSDKIKLGKALYDNEGGKYTVRVVVTGVPANATLKIGISKDAATQSKLAAGSWSTRNSTATLNYAYYYDTDLVAVDNFTARYVGKASTENIPFVLDDEATDDQYMEDAKTDMVTVYLKRTFTLNKWNSLVLPIPMTAAQIKEAFGQETQLAKLVGVGGVSGKTGRIDFATVDLTEENATAIEAATMYLVKPTKDAIQTEFKDKDGETVSGKMYRVGSRALDGSKLQQPQMSLGTDKEGATAQPQVDFKGTYVKLASTDTNCPQKGDYVFSGGDMYYLNKANGIKGFRGWFVDHTGASSIKFNVGDGSVTSIEEVIANDRGGKTNNAVYTVDGVKIRDNASSLEGLPAGLYIFKGKTHLVK